MSENESPKEEPKISAETIATAEEVIGITFTDSEREQMRETVSGYLNHYETLRSIPLENSVSFSLHFQPNVSDSNPPTVPRVYHMSAQDSVTRPDNLEDAAFFTVTQLSTLIRTRQVTSFELTEMYLARLKKYDPVLKCVVTLTEDLAIEQAKRADEEIAQGLYRSPLHGIPYGAKDLLSVKNYKTTWGATPFKDQQFELDATVVQRLESAGAVLVAKLTMGALAYGDIWFDGTTKNPWDITEGSSGSSAGSGSATAAGLVGFAIGTETLGSIVSPSTRNGVSGLRPTYGRVSRHGAMALAWSMDKIGAMCRSVEDTALVFTAIYGPDGQDMTISPQPFTWNPALNARDLRVGYIESAFEMPDEPDEDFDEESIINSQSVLDVLQHEGFNLIPLELPDYDMRALYMILWAEAAAAFDDLTRSNRDDELVWQDDDAFPNRFRSARFVTAVEYIQANRVRTKIMHDFATLMEAVDVFVVPSFGKVLPMTNFTGHPAVVVPNGFTTKHTPTSITFVGGLYKEAEMLAVAKAYQDSTDYHTQYPPMDYDML